MLTHISSFIVLIAILFPSNTLSVFQNGIGSLTGVDSYFDQGKYFEFDAESMLEKTSTSTSRSARHKRTVDRDISHDEGCEIKDAQQQDLNSQKHYFQFNDSNYNLAMVWTGDNGKELIALTTMEYGLYAAQSKLWLSKDFGISFEGINHRIEGAIIRATNGIFKSTIDPKKIILISYLEDMTQTQTRLYITTDGGDTFTKSLVPFYIDGPIVFHPSEADRLLAHSPYQEFQIWVSDDFGRTWKSVQTNAVIYSWGTLDMDPGLLFVALSDSESSSYSLMRSSDYGHSFEKIKDNIYSFGVQGNFIFAAMDGKQGENSRLLCVSKDDGTTWNPTQLPTVTKDRFFSVLDMNEGMVFMHVDDEGDTGAGTLYTSDKDGIVFSTSLKQHLFPEGTSITDFYRVTSMRGVYLASQINDDDSIHTVITFDRGGFWQPVQAPKGSQCHGSVGTCSLQFHNRYSQFKGINAPSGPLSQPNATGLILAHGSVADALETRLPDVFVSNDGGYNWTRSLLGPHHYTIVNHGGLLLAIPAEHDSSNIIKFSYDEGHCWNEYQFNEEPLTITGLLPEPSATSLNVSIWGFGTLDRQWRVITVDFGAILKNECTEDNFMKWVPHESNYAQGCLLGLKETFERVKPDSFCHLSYNHQHKPVASEPCLCNRKDYECDFGFSRNGRSGECELSPDFDPSNLDICISGNKEKITTWGYRKVPGDMCIDGFEPVRHIDKLHETCSGRPIVRNGAGKSVAIVTLILVAVTCCGGILFLVYYKKRKLPCFKSSNAFYRYSQLSQGDEVDKMIDVDIHPTYHDSSDEEMLE